MAKALKEMKCKKCGKIMELPEHCEMNEHGEPEYTCEDCFKEENEDAKTRGSNKRAE